MVIKSFYLSDETLIPKALKLTGLSFDELETMVGRFRKTSCRSGQLRGELVVTIDGNVIIRHHFTKRKIWEAN